MLGWVLRTRVCLLCAASQELPRLGSEMEVSVASQLDRSSGLLQAVQSGRSIAAPGTVGAFVVASESIAVSPLLTCEVTSPEALSVSHPRGRTLRLLLRLGTWDGVNGAESEWVGRGTV